MKVQMNYLNIYFNAQLQRIGFRILALLITVNVGAFSIFAQCGYAPFQPTYSFGSQGAVTTDVGIGGYGEAIAVQPDGKVIVAGSAHSTGSTGWDFAVMRYNTNGSLDTTFGSGGITKIDFSNRTDLAASMSLQPDGKIVVVGRTSMPGDLDGPTWDFAMARLRADGQLELRFGNSGKVITDFAGARDYASKVALQPDGKIVVAGVAEISGDTRYAFTRYLSNGSLDAAFSGDGKVTFDMDASGVNDLAIQPDGKIVAVGQRSWDFGALRITSYGTLNISFGNLGKVSIDFNGESDRASSVAIQDDGKIVLGGSAQSGGWDDFALARLNANGVLDSSFDGDGKATISLSPTNDNITDITVNTFGQVTAVGNVDNPSTFAVVVFAPYVPNPCFSIYSSFINDSRKLNAMTFHGGNLYAAGYTIAPTDILVVALNNDFPM